MRNKEEAGIIHTLKHRGVVLWVLASWYWGIRRLQKELHGAMTLIFKKNSLAGTDLSKGTRQNWFLVWGKVWKLELTAATQGEVTAKARLVRKVSSPEGTTASFSSRPRLFLEPNGRRSGKGGIRFVKPRPQNHRMEHRSWFWSKDSLRDWDTANR